MYRESALIKVLLFIPILKNIFEEYNIKYMICNIYLESEPNIVGDVFNLEKYVEIKNLSSIIVWRFMGCISKIWALPGTFYNLLKPSGKIFIGISCFTPKFLKSIRR